LIKFEINLLELNTNIKVKKTKKFKILWKSNRYGESVVEAKNKEEARKKANNDEDEDFEELDVLDDWDIEEIREIIDE